MKRLLVALTLACAIYTTVAFGQVPPFCIVAGYVSHSQNTYYADLYTSCPQVQIAWFEGHIAIHLRPLVYEIEIPNGIGLNQRFHYRLGESRAYIGTQEISVTISPLYGVSYKEPQ